MGHVFKRCDKMHAEAQRAANNSAASGAASGGESRAHRGRAADAAAGAGAAAGAEPARRDRRGGKAAKREHAPAEDSDDNRGAVGSGDDGGGDHGGGGTSSPWGAAAVTAELPASANAARVDAEAVREVQAQVGARRVRLEAATAGWSVDALAALAAQVELAVRAYAATLDAADLLATLDAC